MNIKKTKHYVVGRQGRDDPETVVFYSDQTMGRLSFDERYAAVFDAPCEALRETLEAAERDFPDASWRYYVMTCTVDVEEASGSGLDRLIEAAAHKELLKKLSPKELELLKKFGTGT